MAGYKAMRFPMYTIVLLLIIQLFLVSITEQQYNNRPVPQPTKTDLQRTVIDYRSSNYPFFIFDQWWFVQLFCVVVLLIGCFGGYFLRGFIKRRKKANRIMKHFNRDLFEHESSIDSSNKSKISRFSIQDANQMQQPHKFTLDDQPSTYNNEITKLEDTQVFSNNHRGYESRTRRIFFWK